MLNEESGINLMQACFLLDCHPNSLRRYVKRGLISAKKEHQGNRWHYVFASESLAKAKELLKAD